MLTIKTFIFNVYQENTYVVSDESGEAVIIDPGCYTLEEREILLSYIAGEDLSVLYLLNTHGHIDHMLGNRFVVDRYKCPFITHPGVVQELNATSSYGAMMGLNPDPSPEPDRLVNEGDSITFGQTVLKVLFTPGHSPGHISFLEKANKTLFSGDVLFRGSIGRTDLPGGNYNTLMESIFHKLLPLPEDTTVYPGHGPTTTIAQEKKLNQFIKNYSA